MRILNITGPVELRFPDGSILRYSPATAPTRALGRPATPATQELRSVMSGDKETGKVRPASEYLQILQKAGHQGSKVSAYGTIRREAQRILGKSLPRAKRERQPNQKTQAKGGRKPSPETALLRAKLAEDAAAGRMRDAGHYTRWLVDQRGVSKGLRQLRPLVYRQMRGLKTPSA